MFCPRCGTEYADLASQCSDCGVPLVAELDQHAVLLPPGRVPPLAAPPAGRADAGSLTQLVNSSGTGLQAWIPREARGWTFAGFVPLGLFALSNKINSWGLLALACSVIPYIGFLVLPVCWIYIGIHGKKLAWQLRRFENREQYKKTMAIWDTAGGIFFAIILFTIVLAAFGIIAGLQGAGTA
jgi:hypothetical protein